MDYYQHAKTIKSKIRSSKQYSIDTIKDYLETKHISTGVTNLFETESCFLCTD